MKKWEIIYLYICLTIIASSSLIFGYWMIFPLNPMYFTKDTTVEKTIYHPGDRITYTISYCKKKAIVGTVYRSLLNGTRTSFTPMTNTLPAGCRTTKVSDLIIPTYTESGRYHLEATIEYKLNPIRKFSTSWKSQEFDIINNEENNGK